MKGCLILGSYINLILQLFAQKMDRSEQLLDKIHQINSNFSVKNNKYSTATTDNLENKLQMLKKKLHVSINKNKEELSQILRDANELYEKVDKSNKNYENEANNQIQRLVELENKMSKKIQLQILERKERQNAIITQFQEKAESLRREIQKQRKIRQNLFAQMTSTLESDIPSIMAQLNEARVSLEEEEAQVSFGCLQLIQQSEKYLKQFTIEQEANSNKGFDLIRDLTKKIRAEIDQEKNACEATHEEVFAYVQQTCNKMVEEL